MVYFWDGTAWTAQTIATPAGSDGMWPQAVSCVTADSCIVVGYYYDTSTGIFETLAESWNGSTWAIQPSANPPVTGTGSFAQLNAVSCATAGSCVTAGNYVSTAGSAAGKSKLLAERLAAGKWTLLKAPAPSGAVVSDFEGVSCPAATRCTAVGFSASSTASGSPASPLAEQWNGSTWAIQAVPSAGTGLNELSAVSCPAVTDCTAVGNSAPPGQASTTTLAEGWDGTTWAIQATPPLTGATSSELRGLSCTGPAACTAVGTQDSASGSDALAETWDGTTWAVQPTATPTADQGLLAVSCLSAAACAASGSNTALSNTAPQPVAEMEGLGPRPVHPGTVATSPFIAGYFSTTPQTTGALAGTFTVPAVTCTSTDNFIISGYAEATATSLISAGVVSGCQGGTPFYAAETDIAGRISVLPVTVGPKAKISVSIAVDAAHSTTTFAVLASGAAKIAPFRQKVVGLGGVLPRPHFGFDHIGAAVPAVPVFTKSTFGAITVSNVVFGQAAAQLTRLNMATTGGILQIATSLPSTKTNGFTETFKSTG
jgi:hypothetical protein